MNAVNNNNVRWDNLHIYDTDTVSCWNLLDMSHIFKMPKGCYYTRPIDRSICRKCRHGCKNLKLKKCDFFEPI
jgi:hypothetical protein